MKKGKALAIDDTLLYRNNIRIYLSVIGFDVDTANDGLEGWTLVKNNLDYKIIFCDLEMPNLDGFEFLKKIKNDPATQNIPVIILSSVDKPHEIEKALKLGASSYMIKPFNNQKMFEVLEKIKVDFNN